LALAADPDLPSFGGLGFLADLVDHAPAPGGAADYGTAIREAWARRILSERAAQVQVDVRNGASAASITAALTAGLAEVNVALDETRGRSPLLRSYRHTPASRITPRECLFGGHYFRRYVSTTTAVSGAGKSLLAIAEALAMATGRPLLGGLSPRERLRVAYVNLEDPADEISRRVAAVIEFHRLDGADLEDWLWWGSGRDAPIVLAEMGRFGGAAVRDADVRRVKEAVKQAELDVVIVDPFVDSHAVEENNNAAVNLVAKTWASIADECAVAVELVHHPRKSTNGQDVGVDDSRGASALLAAARSARALNIMTAAEAEKAGIEPARRRYYLRSEIGKSNLAPPPDQATWYRLESVSLGNAQDGGPGDSVGVVVPWEWPNPLQGVSASDVYRIQQAVAADGDYRESSQAEKWIGRLVADVLRLDLDDPRHHAKIRGLLKLWFTTGVLVVDRRKDGSRQDRPFVAVGRWVSPK
jgi:hypothetical protein